MCNNISYIIIIHALYPTDWFLECCSRSNPLSYSCYFTPKICTVIDFKRTYLIINIHFFIIFASILSNLNFWILFRKMCKMSDWFFICLCCFLSVYVIYTQNYDVIMHAYFARVQNFIICLIKPTLKSFLKIHLLWNLQNMSFTWIIALIILLTFFYRYVIPS